MLFFNRLYFITKYFFVELFSRKSIVVNMYRPFDNRKKTFNFGDDINIDFLELLSGRKVVPSSCSIIAAFTNKTKYSCIGSIINSADKHTIVWGAGAINKILGKKFAPKEILAVRGPLTRQLLLDKGISCPEIYGDPALLISRFYKPDIKKTYKIGVIPHYVDSKSDIVVKYNNYPNVLVIDIQNYGNWTDFVDQILSCEYIISSSLHGIIIADTYNIPNIWCKFSEKIFGDDFKFYDYYSSIGRNKIEPFLINENTELSTLFLLKSNWRKPQIDLEKLLDACPFIYIKK